MKIGATPGPQMAQLKEETGPSPQQAGEQLEAFFLRHMLAEMRSSSSDGMFSGGYGGKMFQEMLDEAMADEMSASGGLGIADLITAELAGREGQAPEGADSLRPMHGAGYGQSAGQHLRTSPVEAPTSSDFGARIHPVTHKRSFHEGIDLAAPKGSRVSSSAPGTVIRAGKAGSYGNLVVVDHGGGLETRYAHLESISVRVGDQLAAGDMVGKVGDTGRATGPHLHFEVRRGGKAVDPKGELANLKKDRGIAQDSQNLVER